MINNKHRTNHNSLIGSTWQHISLYILFGFCIGFLFSSITSPIISQKAANLYQGRSLFQDCAIDTMSSSSLAITQQGLSSLSSSSSSLSSSSSSLKPYDAMKNLQEQLKNYHEIRPSLLTTRPADATFPLARPSVDQRKFHSDVIDQVIDNITRRMKDVDLALLFANTFPNTLDTTVYKYDGELPDAFIITGDIPAQWLRDSTNQVLPYIPFAGNDEKISKLICGLIRRQHADIIMDPYANAFNEKFDPIQPGAEGSSWQNDRRKPPMQPHVFEGKYELDSLASAMKLSYRYYNYTKDLNCFDQMWVIGVRTILKTIEDQQKGTDEEGENHPYSFVRSGGELPFNGRGAPARRTGLSKCGFRPSDDPCQFPFLIPANAMAVVELRHTAEILRLLSIQRKQLAPITSRTDIVGKYVATNIIKLEQIQSELDLIALAQRAESLSNTIDDAIKQHGVIKVNGQPERFTFEVDGQGNMNHMDDANIPSLLGLPYLGYITTTDPLYLRTRQFVWSSQNPWYSEGAVANGIGGPHIGMHHIWPMSLIMKGLTSEDEAEIKQCLAWIKASSAGTGLLHESFWKDNAAQFTRKWFAWVNTLFGELILKITRERPHLIF